MLTDDEEKHMTRSVAGRGALLLPVCLFGFLLVLLAGVLLRLENKSTLFNVTLASKPEYTAAGFIEGSYQNAWDKWLQDNFYGHTAVIKCLPSVWERDHPAWVEHITSGAYRDYYKRMCGA